MIDSQEPNDEAEDSHSTTSVHDFDDMPELDEDTDCGCTEQAKCVFHDID